MFAHLVTVIAMKDSLIMVNQMGKVRYSDIMEIAMRAIGKKV